MYALRVLKPDEIFYNYYFKCIVGNNNKVLSREPQLAMQGTWDEMEKIQYQVNSEKKYQFLMIIQLNLLTC